MYRKLLIGAALVAGLGAVAPAFAADGDYTGFHVGVNGGYGGGEFRYPFAGSASLGASTGAVTGEAKLKSSGFLGGGQVGWDYQNANGAVFGAEADIAATDIKGDVTASGNLTGTLAGNASINAGSKLVYLGTVRARAGMNMGPALFYATGGFAYGKVKSGVTATVSGASPLFTGATSQSKTRTGWTAGAGLEYPLSSNLTFRTEYLYTDLGTATVLNTPFSLLGATGSASLKVKTTANIVRVGLNYRFQ